MDLKYLQKIMDMFDVSNATEISLEEEGSKIKLSKKQNVVATQAVTPPPVQQIATPTPTPVPTPLQAPRAESAESPKIADNSGLHEITSPMVGTFYATPSPDSPPFVKVGDKVDIGSPLCIVEAMKLMNEIESDAKGTVEKIMLQSTDPVEYGQLLFLIKPD